MFFLMIRRTPRSTVTVTLFPSTTLFRSRGCPRSNAEPQIDGKRSWHFVHKSLDLIFAAHSVRENHVGARCGIHLSPLDGLVQAFDRNGVREIGRAHV